MVLKSKIFKNNELKNFKCQIKMFTVYSHSWFFICICIELSCAFDAYSLLTTLFDFTISLANMTHASFSPFFAASFIIRFDFSCSLCIANKIKI